MATKKDTYEEETVEVSGTHSGKGGHRVFCTHRTD